MSDHLASTLASLFRVEWSSALEKRKRKLQEMDEFAFIIMDEEQK